LGEKQRRRKETKSKDKELRYSHAERKEKGVPMKQRDLKRIGIALVIGGLMLFLDGLGSLLLPANYHDFWFDLERVFRMLGSFLLIILGAYFVKETS